VQDSPRRVWIDARQMRFGSIDELNAWVGERCRQLWTEVKHPEHKQFSVAEVLEHERLQIMPMPVPVAFDGYVEEVARISSTCLATVARNRYSVPCELAGQMLSTRLYPTRVMVVADDVIVADHQRLMDKGKICYVATKGPLRGPLAPLHPAARAQARRKGPKGSFVAQATGLRSPTCPSRCSECAERCCARPAATA